MDFHIMNEYTSPEAFVGLDAKGLKVWRPEAHLAAVGHVNATRSVEAPDAQSKIQIDNLESNCKKPDIAFYGLGDSRQGIEHIVFPEQGLASPGMLIACGYSHTTTYGAFGALGFGIGTSEVEHVLAAQILRYKRMKTMRISVDGDAAPGVTAKDIIMKVVQVIGAGGASGFAIEFSGSAICNLDMAGRMTVCNMAVKIGAQAALIAADEVTQKALAGHDYSDLFEYLSETWETDRGAIFDKEIKIAGGDIEPLVTWGTSPDQSVPITGAVPSSANLLSPKVKAGLLRTSKYIEQFSQAAQSISIDTAFIGSCTNSRIEDLRQAADVLRGWRIPAGVEAIVMPGSAITRLHAEAEGLPEIFEAAGFQWRLEAGCSMCLAMNDDIALEGERVASSTNRNFEVRQGRGARTHLMSPAIVSSTAVSGHFADARDFV